MANDRRGSGLAMMRVNGASNHCNESRADDDFYATPPSAVEMLCDMEKFSKTIFEPCCGQGHVANVLKSRGYDLVCHDLVDRGYGDEHGVDFLMDYRVVDGDWDVVTNPPYNMAQEFVEHALDVVGDGHKVAMFLKLTFAEGKARRSLFSRTPPPQSVGVIVQIGMWKERDGVESERGRLLLVGLAEGL